MRPLRIQPGVVELFAVVVPVLCVLGACSGQRTPTKAVNTSASAKQTSEPARVRPVSAWKGSGPVRVSDENRAAIEQMGIKSPCVLHAVDSRAERKETRAATGQVESLVTTGNCSFNAECVRQQGKDSVGDGDVEVECRDRACSCSLRSWVPSEKSLSFSFQVDGVCSTADMAERLLKAVCMAGLPSNDDDKTRPGSAPSIGLSNLP